MIQVPSVAETYDLDIYLGTVDPWYHLFTNDLTIDEDTVLADFVEADWPDYIARRANAWTPSLIVAGRAVSSSDPLLWIRGNGGSPRDVYGYYVTDDVSGPLLWCERRQPGPLPMVGTMDSVEILPRLTLREDPDSE